MEKKSYHNLIYMNKNNKSLAYSNNDAVALNSKYMYGNTVIWKLPTTTNIITISTIQILRKK